MVRTYEWFRGTQESVGYDDAGFVPAALATPAGSTLIRTLWVINFEDRHEVLFSSLPWGMLVYGLIIQTGPAFPDPPLPITDTDHDWLWYEGVRFRRSLHTLASPSYALNEGPVDGGQRESEGQRKLPNTGSRLCWSYQANGTIQSSPFVHVQVTYEALVLLPP